MSSTLVRRRSLIIAFSSATVPGCVSASKQTSSSVGLSLFLMVGALPSTLAFVLEILFSLSPASDASLPFIGDEVSLLLVSLS